MAFVHPQSCECMKSELDIFTVPPTQTSIETGNWVEYNPIATLDDGSSIEFCVSGSGQDYLMRPTLSCTSKLEFYKRMELQ